MDGVLILPSFYEAIRELPDAERLAVYDAIARYGLYGEIIDLPPVVKPVFTLIKPVIDSSQRRYQAAKANGRKGGRPRKNQTGKQIINQSDNQVVNQTANQDKDLDSDLEIDCDLETEKDINYISFIEEEKETEEPEWMKRAIESCKRLGIYHE